MSGNDQRLRLKTLLATYPATEAVKQGHLTSGLVSFDFADVRLANTKFRALVRDHAFDVGELAIVTFLQAFVSGTPYALLPAVIVGRSQHHTIVYDSSRGRLTPADVEGRRVGVRAYAQTTGAWVRGILEDDYGVDIRRVEWVTLEESHVSGYTDPPWVVRADENKQLLPMLMVGEIDAAIFGNELPDAPVAPLIPAPEMAAAAWAARHSVNPINHLVVVRASLVRDRPDVVRDIYRILRESRARVPEEGTPVRFGIEENRRAIELIIDYSLRQQLIPRRIEVDELFEDAASCLGAGGSSGHQETT